MTTIILQGKGKVTLSIRDQNIIDNFINGNKPLIMKYIFDYIFNGKKNIIDRNHIRLLMQSVFPKDKIYQIYNKHIDYLISAINTQYKIDLIV